MVWTRSNVLSTYINVCKNACIQKQTSEFIHILFIACCVFLEGSCITFAIKKSTLFFIYHYFLKLKAQVYSVYLKKSQFFGPLLHWLQNPWSQAVSKCFCLRLWFWFWGKYRTRAARSQQQWSILRSDSLSFSPPSCSFSSVFFSIHPLLRPFIGLRSDFL